MTTLLIALWAFFSGVFVGELLTLREKRCKPKRDRLSTNYWVGDDGRIFQVRCRPGRFERLCDRMEDELCQGR